jgi:crossover junction endodeoxyribonuclease RusA
MTTIKMLIYGVPIAQGSMKGFLPKGWTRPIITSDSKKTKPWKQEIAGAAASAMTKRKLDQVSDGPVLVELAFYFDRPKSLKKTILHKVTKPDVDKLARAVLDALTGPVFKDDSQVVSLRITKGFDATPRAEITINFADHSELPLFQS